ncbi:MAG: hypothetical protein Kow0063_38050 [Anaerolineae bacterium]
MENENRLVAWLRRNIVFLAVLVAIILLAVVCRILFLSLLPWSLKPTPAPAITSVPTPTPVRVTVGDIRPLAELATIEYQTVAEIQDERVPDDFRQYLGIKEEVLLLAYGNVKAGFDLSGLSEEDLWTDGTRVQLHLPPPEILSTSIDYDRTHVVYHRGTLLMSRDINWEGEIFKTAQDSIRQGAIEAGILEDAARYGQLYFENFLRSLGFTEVRVIVD